MPCYHPSKLDVKRKSLYDSASRVDTVTVPCGTCIGCRADQGRNWAIRIKHEMDLHPLASWFITLTYDREHLPGNGKHDERTQGTLDPEDLRLFWRRLRERSYEKLGYYACGEYGDDGSRPHYHLALFGMQLLDRQLIGHRRGSPVWQSDTLEKTWGMGSVDITTISWKSASYIAGYVTKKAREKANPTNHLRVDEQTGELFEVEPEFSRMSRRPAIGRNWLERYWKDVYPNDFVVVNGQPFKPPRYYDKRMEEISPETMEAVRYQRWKDAEEIGDEKLIMMEKVHRARLRIFGNRSKM